MFELSICKEGIQLLDDCFPFWKNYINSVRMEFDNQEYSYDKWLSFLVKDLKKYSATMNKDVLSFEKDELATLFLLKYS